MKRTVFGVITVLILFTGMSSWSCSQAESANPPEKISIGFTIADTTALLMIAEDQHFFADNGLDATLKPYSTAIAALAGMNKGEVDVAENAEFPIISEAFHKTNLNIIACVDRFDIVNLAGRRDRGIQNIADLKGKTIGVPKGAVAEFYMGRFMELNGLASTDVKMVNLPFQQAVDALPGGNTDAFMIRYKDISTVNDRLGGNVVIWNAQNGQMGFDVLSGQKDWAQSHSKTVEKLLKALLQAEAYVTNHHTEAMASVQKRLNYDDIQMAASVAMHQYSVSLDQSLITAMEDETRWMIKNSLTTEGQVPNFLDYIDENPLKTIKPEVVNIIR